MIRTGIFGANPRSKRHIENLKQIPGFTIAGIYDPDPGIAGKASRDLDIPPFTSPGSLIQRSDAIVFELPVELHYEILIPILTSSKHLFINYPVCFSLEKLSHMSKLANEANIILQVGNHERFHPALQPVISTLKKPVFIEIVRNLGPDRHREGEVLFEEFLIRDIDMVFYLNKSNVQRVSAIGVPLRSDLTDLVNTRLEFDNGCVANITVNMYCGTDNLVCQVFQKSEWFRIDLGQNAVMRHILKDHKQPESLSEECLRDETILKTEALPTPPYDPLHELKVFRDSIVRLQAPPVGIDHAFYAAKITREILGKLLKNAQS